MATYAIMVLLMDVENAIVWEVIVFPTYDC